MSAPTAAATARFTSARKRRRVTACAADAAVDAPLATPPAPVVRGGRRHALLSSNPVLYFKWLFYRNELMRFEQPPGTALGYPHVCTPECSYRTHGNMHMCVRSGNVHVCSAATCSRLVSTPDSMTCELTGRSYALAPRATDADKWNGVTGYNYSRARGSASAAASASYGARDGGGDDAFVATECDVGDDNVVWRVPLHPLLGKRARSATTAPLPVPPTPPSLPTARATPVKTGAALPVEDAMARTSATRAKARRKGRAPRVPRTVGPRIADPNTLAATAAGVARTFLRTGCCSDPKHVAQIAAHCVETWGMILRSLGWQLASQGSRHTFAVHCRAVLFQMRRGLCVGAPHLAEATWVIPRSACVQAHLPSKTQLSRMMPSVGTMTETVKRVKANIIGSSPEDLVALGRVARARAGGVPVPRA